MVLVLAIFLSMLLAVALLAAYYAYRAAFYVSPRYKQNICENQTLRQAPSCCCSSRDSRIGDDWRYSMGNVSTFGL